MKQKLQRLKGGRLGSQLFLKTFMLLAFMLSGVGSAWADTYVFDQNAQRVYETNLTKFTFGDKVIQLTCDRTDAKPQQDANDEIQKGIKYSSGRTYTFTFPTDEIVKRIVFTGFARSTEAVSYINKINGNVRNDGNNEPGSTQFPHKQTSDDDENVISPTGTYEVNFYSRLQNTVSFEIAGVETNLIITVVTEKPSQKFTVNFSVPNVHGAYVPEGTLTIKNITQNKDAVANDYVVNQDTQEKRMSQISGSFEVNNGDEIEITAWDFCANTAQGNVPEGRMILEGWKINDGHLLTDNIPTSGISWWHSPISYRFKVTGDTDIKIMYMLDYLLHFPDRKGTVDGDGREYTYEGGTAHAFIGNEKIWDGSSGFRGNTTIVATATPASGYKFDHWEGYVKGAGDDPVWSNDNWSKDNPFTFKSDGEVFDYAFGNDIYIKPVFASLGTVIGPADMSGFYDDANDYSADVKLTPMQECTFEFDVKTSGNNSEFQWVLNASENQNTYSVDAQYFTVLSGNKSFNNDWSQTDLHTLALVGGALDMEQFKRDLEGAHVTAKVSYDGEQMFVYQVIENNGRTYTYYYPYTLPSDKKDKDVYVRVGVEKSQLTNYSAVVKKAYKFNADVNPAGAGNVVFTNEQGVEVLNHAIVGTDTKVYITATANDGYVFKDWGGSDIKEYQRTIVAGFDAWNNPVSENTTKYDFTAYFNNAADYETTWSTQKPSGDVYYKNGNEYIKCTSNTLGWHPGVTYSGFYYKDGDTYKELSTTEGLLFSANTGLGSTQCSSVSGNNFVLANTNWGLAEMKIPAHEGEFVSVEGFINKKTESIDVWYENENGNRFKHETVNLVNSENGDDKTNFVLQAPAGTKYIVLGNHLTSNPVYITALSKTAIRDFAFADGNTIPAQPGCDDYINTPIAPNDLMQPIVDAATFTWTSSNPADVAVDANTGRIIVNNSFNGSVRITATMNAVKDANGNVILPAIAKSYILTTSTNKLQFANAEILKELSESGSASDWQWATWSDPEHAPEGEIHYTIVSTSAKEAKITEDENTDDSWYVTNIGAGITVIKATCGALSATYIFNTWGLVFNEGAAVYDFSGSYGQTISGNGITYSIIQKHGAIKDVNLTIDGNGNISGLPKYDDNKGGAIVVQATNNSGKKVSYVLTIPYKKYTWNFYDEQVSGDIKEIQTINSNKHFTIGDLANGANPGAADQVDGSDNGVTIPYATTGKFPEQYISNYGDEGLKTHIRRQLRWQNAQNDNNVKNDANDPHNYWNYTFKTQTRVDKNKYKPINYCNEPLFAYKYAVNGNNVRIVNETQGLIFNCAANAFGINDNNAYSATADYNNAVDVREQDRAILVFKDNSFTIPFVKKNHYVKLHWYRHSYNAGDMFSVTNAKDLDGNYINKNHRLRFTGSHYEGRSEWRGYTILQAAEDGPMTITNTAPSSWFEIYTIELTDEYKTELKVEYAHVQGGNDAGWGGPVVSGYANNWMFDMHDNIVGVVRKIGDAANNKAYTEAEISAPGWESLEDMQKGRDKITNCAAVPTQRVGENPIIYVGSFPGYTNGWNGWTLDVEAFPVEEDARNLKIGLQKELMARVGNRISYGVHALTNFEGTGTAHVIVRTKNGSVDGSPRYTLDMQEAYFPVGEYHDQTYPYTWDFTNYNMESPTVYDKDVNKDERTYTYMTVSKKESYGAWKSANNTRKMLTVANNEDQNPDTRGIAATVPYSLPESNARRYNKFLFADGSQFTVNGGVNGAEELRETDGLRMNIGCDMGVWKDRAVTVYNDNKGIELPAGGTITVPKVNHGMYIYIRSAQEPTSVVADEVANGIQEFGKEEGNTIMSEDVSFLPNDDPAVVALHVNDIPNNVWVYRVRVNGATTSKTFDVTVTPSAPIEGIGVTKYSKNTVQFPGINEATLMTDARNENIDFHNTGFFTKHDLKAYVARSEAEMSDSGHGENGVIGLDEIVVLPSKENSGTDNRGLVLKKTASESGLTARPRLPLFVPACNIANDNLNNNHLVGVVDATNVELPSYIKDAKDQPNNIYILTNQHYDWDWEKAAWVAQNVGSAVNPSNLADGWHVDTQASFYILRDGGKPRPNSAYLKVPRQTTSEVKNFYMIYGAEFDEEEATGIETIDTEAEIADVDGADVYTVTGIKVAKPTKKGLYVVNGKKVYVK